MNKTDLSPELQELLEREIKTHLRRLHYVPGTNTSKDIIQISIEMVLSDTAKRIHQEGMISVGQAKNLISLAWATASAYGDKTDEADCQDWIKHNL